MADRSEMFGLTRGFSGMANAMEPCKMLWADPCCHGYEIWARRGDPVAYRLVLLLFLHVSTGPSEEASRGNNKELEKAIVWRYLRRMLATYAARVLYVKGYLGSVVVRTSDL